MHESPTLAESNNAPSYLRECALALTGYALMLAVAWWCGFRMHVPYDYYQILNRPWLEDRLGQTLLYLHAQPPMLNVILGFALKLSRLWNGEPEPILLTLHIGLGAAATVAFVYLAQVLIPRRPWRWIAIVLFLANPVFYMTLFHYFYPMHELAILLVLAVVVHRYFLEPQLRTYVCVCALVILLIYTRALFHFLWGIALIAALPLLTKRKSDHSIPQHSSLAASLVFGISVFLMLAWPAKNALIFGVFSYSSWQGYNLSTGFNPEIGSLTMGGGELPERFRGIPALEERLKTNKDDNWNHFSYIGDSKLLGRAAIDRILHEPMSLVRKMAWNYFYFTRYAGRHPYIGYMELILTPTPPRAMPWLLGYEMAVFQDFRQPFALAQRSYRREPPKPWHVSGFFVLFPVIVVLSCRRVLILRKGQPNEAALAAFFLYCILWVFAMSLLIDGSEANRHRFSTEPFTLLLAFWVLVPISWVNKY